MQRKRRRDWRDPFSWFQWQEWTRPKVARPGSYQGLGGVSSFARADASTCATYRDQNGVVRTVAANILRDQHYVGTVRTVLLESARQNLLLQTEDQSSGSWTNIGTPTVSANSDTAPDGATTADTVGDDSAAALEGKRQTFTVPNDSNKYTSTQFVKKTSGAVTYYPVINIRFTGGTTADGYVAIDTTAGTVDADAAGAGATATARCTSWNDTYWRVEITVNNNSTGNTSLLRTWFPSYATTLDASAANLAATGTQVVWGDMLELGDFATSYIATTTAAVTRAVDALVLKGVSANGTLFQHYYDLATAAWVSAASAYTGGSTITLTVDRAYYLIAVLPGTKTAAQCAGELGALPA